MLVWSNSVYYCSLLLLLFSHSVVSDSLWSPWTAAHQVSLSFTLSWSLIKLMSIESVMPSNHLILCRPILLLPSIFSSIRVFSNDLAFCTRRPKSIGASASASVLPMNSQSWFRLGLTVLILQSEGLSRVFSGSTVCEIGRRLNPQENMVDLTSFFIIGFFRAFVHLLLSVNVQKTWNAQVF